MLYRQVLDGARKLFSGPHPMTAFVLRNLAEALRASGDSRGSEDAYLEALDMNVAALGEDHQETLITKIGLASLYFDQERYHEAEPLLVAGYAGMEDHPEASEADRRFVRKHIALVFERTGRAQEAAAWRAREPSSPQSLPAR